MRTALTLLLFTAFLSSATYAQTPRVERIEITEFGIYEKKDTKTTDSPGTALGILHETEIKLIQQTTTIPARPGITFGYRYKVIGRPANGKVTLKDVNIVPPPGLHNPATGNTFYRKEVQTVRSIGKIAHSDYTLGSDNLLPGTWTFQLWVGDRKLAEQIFTLVKP